MTPKLQAKEIRKIEAQAVQSPKWFSLKLRVTAVSAEIVFQLLFIFPIALPLAVGAALLPNRIIIGLTLFAILLIWWTLQPNTRIDGIPVPRDQAPRLYQILDELIAKADSLRIHEIRIDDELNASALELGHGWIPGKVRRILILGGPLIATLSENSLRAVVAHELGHFSKRHGALGHWLYRARINWSLASLYDSTEDSILDRGMASYGTLFLSWFDKYFFVHSRQCEYEADAVAASIVGNETLCLALAELGMVAHHYYDESVINRDDFARSHTSRPLELWQLEAERVLQASLDLSAFEKLWNEPSSSADTHPSLKARCEALGLSFENVWHILPNSELRAEIAFEPGVVKAAGELSKKELSQWRLQHARLSAEKVLDWNASRLSNVHAKFAELKGRIKRNDTFAIQELQELISSHPSWTLAARGLLTTVPQEMLNEEEQRKNEALLDTAITRRRLASRTWQEAFFDTYTPPSLNELEVNTHEVLSACVKAPPYIKQASAALSEVSIQSGKRTYPIVLLWVRSDSEEMTAHAINEIELRDLLRYQLANILGENVIAIIRTTYITESVPQWTSELKPLIAR